MDANAQTYNYKLTLAYDGTRYCGWQVQPNGISIQQLIQKSLETILKQPIAPHGAGRTDAGVHALNQVIHFTCDRQIDTRRCLRSINGLLPPDIRAKSLKAVPHTFHARYSAIGKVYHYVLHIGEIQDPFQHLYHWHLFEKVDVSLMKQAASLFIGTHDFVAFANEAHRGTASHDSIRTMKRLDIIEEGETLRLEFEADGFLYKMVRNIVGTLVEIAMAKRDIADIAAIFEKKDRRLAGRAAPSHGLFLVKVKYPIEYE